MAPTPREKWNRLYSSGEFDGVDAVTVLSDNLHLLPESGIALDLACGLGANALLLAQLGLQTHAWDCSDVAITRLTSRADTLGVVVHTQCRDILENPPSHQEFDVIIVSHFLVRDLASRIINALKPSGVLFYQTFTANKLNDVGPDNPDYLLQANELLRLFNGLSVRYYREDDRCGRLESGNRNEAMLVAQKA